MDLRIDCSTLTPVQAKEFLKAYLAAMPNRIAALERTVRSERGWGNWSADGSRESIDRLGEWIQRILRVVPADLSKGEMHWNPRNPVLTPKVRRELERSMRDYAIMTLDEASDAIADDVEMYLGWAIHRAVPEARWSVVTGTSYINFNFPILSVRKHVGYMPRHGGGATIRAIAERRVPSGALANLFDDMIMFLREDVASVATKKKRKQ